MACAKSSALACGFFQRARMLEGGHHNKLVQIPLMDDELVRMNDLDSVGGNDIKRKVLEVCSDDAVRMPCKGCKGCRKYMHIARVGQLQAIGERLPSLVGNLPVRHGAAHLVAPEAELSLKSGRFSSSEPIHSASILVLHFAANRPVVAKLISESAMAMG